MINNRNIHSLHKQREFNTRRGLYIIINLGDSYFATIHQNPEVQGINPYLSNIATAQKHGKLKPNVDIPVLSPKPGARAKACLPDMWLFHVWRSQEVDSDTAEVVQ